MTCECGKNPICACPITEEELIQKLKELNFSDKAIYYCLACLKADIAGDSIALPISDESMQVWYITIYKNNTFELVGPVSGL